MAKINIQGLSSAFTEEELIKYRLEALWQACRDDKGNTPQCETLARAEAYFQFLMGQDKAVR